jgi:DnaK suppressor protein
MNHKEKDLYRKRLLAEKKEILEQLMEFYNESRQESSPMAQDLVDRAESSYTKEFLLSLSDSERKRLAKIDSALKRLEQETFGLCQTCGKEITKKRLNAIPWAAFCIECQKKSEESGA